MMMNLKMKKIEVIIHHEILKEDDSLSFEKKDDRNLTRLYKSSNHESLQLCRIMNNNTYLKHS